MGRQRRRAIGRGASASGFLGVAFAHPALVFSGHAEYYPPEAWAPFAEGRNHIFANPTLQAVAKRHNKSVAQVILRWLIQRGIVVPSKSVRKSRMAEKLDMKLTSSAIGLWRSRRHRPSTRSLARACLGPQLVRCHQADSQGMSPSQLSTQSAVARRSAEAQVRGLIARFAPAQQRLVGTMRRSLRKRLPTAHEVVYEYRDCCVISYSPNERGYEGVLAIRASADGVALYFTRGKELPDPANVLRGAGKQVRFIQMEGASTLTRPAVRRLIDEAIGRHRVPFARTGRGPVVIRAVSAKQRGRRRPA